MVDKYFFVEIEGNFTFYINRLSPNHDKRFGFIVIGWTVSSLQNSIDTFSRPNSTSVHYMVPKSDRVIYRIVEESERANCIGRSRYQGVNEVNNVSLCVWLVHSGNDQDPYEEQQINLLIDLLKELKRRHNIDDTRILAHGDVYSPPNSRHALGPLFPWKKLYLGGIGIWPEESDVIEARPKQCINIVCLQKKLVAFGFSDLRETNQLDSNTTNTLRVFQRHFNITEKNGQPSVETCATLSALLKKYPPNKNYPYAQNGYDKCNLSVENNCDYTCIAN